ncbi:acyl-CoA thioesterase domain-containing protein [Bradyrhizobium australiense]|uniref:Thioesterase family protein n=1 Tax=Bradyrhizobium australiense TaxID=2721161 RepID=A0A7Y4LWV6_9BRAD|nr:acyl-CoA thioesterase domain-containing protein [Bradyrhizobium australiense]NOJ41833.1 thioesterase family protein [Bradyrhizobium australiense]
MAIFESVGSHRWQPTALAAGPFAGLQGGAVASLLAAEVEALADQRRWGTAISCSAWFLRPTPMAELRTAHSVVTDGGRVSVIDNTLWPADEDQPCATARVTLSRERAVEVPGFADLASEAADPMQFPIRTKRAAHGKPWFMEAMEARQGDGIAWFRMNHNVIDGAGPSSMLPLSSVLGPADWTHGIARPVQDVVADPNPNLTVQLFRRPAGDWVGVRAQARWRPANGLGVGSGVLLDVNGEIGRVSMSVILVPFPRQAKAEPAAGLAPASN